MKRLTIGIVACAAVLGASAPVASADKAAVSYHVRCTGAGTWTVNQLGSYADLLIPSYTCKTADASVDDGSNVHLDTFDWSGTNAYRVNLLAAGVWSQNTFAAEAFRGGTPIGPMVATSGILNATFHQLNVSEPGTAVEVHRGTGSCGTHCYKVDVTWTHVIDRMP
jgi:hypothetical protein